MKARFSQRQHWWLEDRKRNGMRSDSSTCMKENIRIMVTISVSCEWELHSLDIRVVFLQSKCIEKELFIERNKEGMVLSVHLAF